jgi:hypothetical protein
MYQFVTLPLFLIRIFLPYDFTLSRVIYFIESGITLHCRSVTVKFLFHWISLIFIGIIYFYFPLVILCSG